MLDFGGVEKRMLNISSAVPNGVELVFVVLGKGGWAAREIEKNGCRVICLNHPFKIPNWALAVKLTRLLKRLKADVVHSAGAEANFHGQLAAYFAGVNKRIAEEIGFPAHSAIARGMFRLVYRFCDNLVCVAQAVAEKVIEMKEIKPGKVRVVPNPAVIPANRLSPQKKTHDTFVFVTVCRLTKIKNLDGLLRAFSVLIKHYPKALINIVGDGPEQHNLVQLTHSLGLTGSVFFKGFSDNPFPLLSEADVFILPSFSEGMSNAIMEAFLAGLPCIVSNVGGSVELVKDGENGWFINPLSEADMVDKMSLAIQTKPAVLGAMGLNGMRNIEKNFSLDAYWGKLMKMYTV